MKILSSSTYPQTVRVFVTNSGFRRLQVQTRDDGFSLLEVVVNVFLSSLLLALVMRELMVVCVGFSRVDAVLEKQSMWRNVSRSLTQDVHAAVGSSSLQTELQLTMVDGTHYRYYVNGNGQLIRDRVGGGTSVIGAGIQAFVCQVSTSDVQVQVRTDNGEVHTLFVSSLAAAAS